MADEDQTNARREVRAGPGDAGASDRPDPLPKTPQSERRRREARPLIIALVIFTVIAMVVMALLAGGSSPPA